MLTIMLLLDIKKLNNIIKIKQQKKKNCNILCIKKKKKKKKKKKVCFVVYNITHILIKLIFKIIYARKKIEMWC